MIDKIENEIINKIKETNSLLSRAYELYLQMSRSKLLNELNPTLKNAQEAEFDIKNFQKVSKRITDFFDFLKHNYIQLMHILTMTQKEFKLDIINFFDDPLKKYILNKKV